MNFVMVLSIQYLLMSIVYYLIFKSLDHVLNKIKLALPIKARKIITAELDFIKKVRIYSLLWPYGILFFLRSRKNEARN